MHVSLFGSAARGDGNTESDIDLFVVRPERVFEEDIAWQTQLSDLARKIRLWTGNRASVVELSESEAGRLGDKNRPIVGELRSDAIVLSGSEVPVLLGTA